MPLRISINLYTYVRLSTYVRSNVASPRRCPDDKAASDLAHKQHSLPMLCAQMRRRSVPAIIVIVLRGSMAAGRERAAHCRRI